MAQGLVPTMADNHVSFCALLFSLPGRMNQAIRIAYVWRPHQELNLDLILRRNLFYPLNYRDVSRPSLL